MIRDALILILILSPFLVFGAAVIGVILYGNRNAPKDEPVSLTVWMHASILKDADGHEYIMHFYDDRSRPPYATELDGETPYTPAFMPVDM